MMAACQWSSLRGSKTLLQPAGKEEVAATEGSASRMQKALQWKWRLRQVQCRSSQQTGAP
jgi:hypothetical protein